MFSHLRCIVDQITTWNSESTVAFSCTIACEVVGLGQFSIFCFSQGVEMGGRVLQWRH